MYTEENLYSIALRECSNIGDINFHKLIKAFGCAENAWKAPSKELQKIAGIGRKTISDIGDSKHLKFAEKEIIFCENNNIQINLRHLDQLPFLLKECEDAPAILYQKGNINPNSYPVSLVGTRKITSYGKSFINTFFENSKKYKFVSVSGLALGTDKEVHTESIRQKIPTVAVLAHGFHTLYPSSHKNLSEKILSENGALFTEFNSSRKPDRENFIQRNRIIAGISHSTIIVETAFGGGSISTATFANNYNRDVFALPGKITEKFSQGCNNLIFQNKATAISTIQDLINLIGFNSPKEKIEELFPKAKPAMQLSENQESIYNTIISYPQISLDDLANRIAQPTYKILTTILELELLGKVKSLSGRQFVSI
jgi:DNA processing protein